MKKNTTEKISNNLVNAFLKNKIISPLPKRYTKKLINADKFRKLLNLLLVLKQAEQVYL